MDTTKNLLAARILLAGLLMSATRPALAGDAGSWSGTTLFDYCREGSLNTQICSGYIVGVVEATSDQICYPSPGATYFQIIQVVVRFLVVHPERLHLQALDLVLALHEAFPCPP